MGRNGKNSENSSTGTDVFGDSDTYSRLIEVSVHPFVVDSKFGITFVKGNGDVMKVERTLVEVFPIGYITFSKTALEVKGKSNTYIWDLNCHVDCAGD